MDRWRDGWREATEATADCYELTWPWVHFGDGLGVSRFFFFFSCALTPLRQWFFNAEA